jgi:hypothetical protein
VVMSEKVTRARWIEAEALHLKIMGLTFYAIAEHIMRVGQNRARPLTKMAEGVSFPSDFKISRQACCKAVQRAFGREPALRVEELRKLDHARSEELLANLQPGVRQGNVPAIVAAVKVLDHSAKINNLLSAPRGFSLPVTEPDIVRRQPGIVIDTFQRALVLMAEYRLLPPGLSYNDPAIRQAEVVEVCSSSEDLDLKDEDMDSEKE